jgi:peptide/nickel transport system permease protein
MEPEYISTGEIVVQSIIRFWPTWAALALTLIGGFFVRERLGTFGRLYGSPIGIAGLALVLFWVFTAIFADIISPFGPRDVPSDLLTVSAVKQGMPGVINAQAETPYLWGGDNNGRDIFSRVVYGARVVLIIAPAATLIAYMVGITLGLPAGYYTGRIDTVLSFVANLVLAFPVILLFYLLVTPEIRALNYDTWLGRTLGVGWSIPRAMAAFFFMFPIVFLVIMWFTKYEKNQRRLMIYGGATVLIGLWLYFGIVFDSDLGPIALDPNELNVFAAVVFASSPGVFRIVRGLTMDIKTRDYVAAAQTRGERPWYIMLWEILPNARGPLIVDACLRIGYTTILLGTLGFFGLGLEPESPDWGSMINHGRSFVRLAETAHMALFPAVALMTLVLGLNLMADGLREESLKD